MFSSLWVAYGCCCLQCYTRVRTRYGFVSAIIRRLRRLVQLYTTNQKPWKCLSDSVYTEFLRKCTAAASLAMNFETKLTFTGFSICTLLCRNWENEYSVFPIGNLWRCLRTVYLGLCNFAKYMWCTMSANVKLQAAVLEFMVHQSLFELTWF